MPRGHRKQFIPPATYRILLLIFISFLCWQLGAYLVDSPLGRRWSLAGSTFATAIFCVFFVIAQNSLALRISTIGISLSATVRTRPFLNTGYLSTSFDPYNKLTRKHIPFLSFCCLGSIGHVGGVIRVRDLKTPWSPVNTGF